MMERAAGASGSGVERAREALSLATALGAAGAEYFESNPAARTMLETMTRMGLPYVVHEYLQPHWHPRYFVDVAREMAASSLHFIGQLPLHLNYRDLALSPALRDLFKDVADRIAFESLKDFALNEFFRRDAQQNLDTIAVAGGSKTALVISTSEVVSRRLVEALGEVRRSSEACEYAIPMNGGELPDLAHATVRLTPPGGEPALARRRASALACDPSSGGYYFDKDPSGPTPPGRIILCPATCDLFGDAQARPIEVLVVCE